MLVAGVTVVDSTTVCARWTRWGGVGWGFMTNGPDELPQPERVVSEASEMSSEVLIERSIAETSHWGV